MFKTTLRHAVLSKAIEIIFDGFIMRFGKKRMIMIKGSELNKTHTGLRASLIHPASMTLIGTSIARDGVIMLKVSSAYQKASDLYTKFGLFIEEDNPISGDCPGDFVSIHKNDTVIVMMDTK